MINILHRFVFKAGWAKSLSWYDKTSNSKIHHAFSVCIVEREQFKWLRLILGPVSISIGFIGFTSAKKEGK